MDKQNYIFKLFSEEAFPVLLAMILLSVSCYSWFFYKITRKKNMKYISLVNLAQLVKATLIFFIFAIDLIPKGERLNYFVWYVLWIDAAANIISVVFLAKVFKFHDEGKYTGYALGSIYLAALAYFYFASGTYVPDAYMGVPFILSCMAFGLPIMTIFPLTHIEMPDISLIILNKSMVILFLLLSIATTISYAFFENYYFSNYLLLVSYLPLFFFTNSLVDLVKIDYEDKIGDVEKEKKVFSALTHNIGKELVKTDNVQEIVKLINDAAAKTTQALSSVIWMLDPDDNKYKAMALYGNYPPLYACKPYILERSDRIIKKVMSDKFKIGETYAGYVAKTKRSIFLSNLKKEPDERITQTTNGLLDIDDIICVPVILEDECIGVMSVVNKEVFNQSFSTADMSMLNTLADQVAIAYSQFKLHKDNLAQKMSERDLDIAGEIQQGLLPEKFPITDSVDFHGFSYAAKGVGGDYFDYVKYSDEKFGFIMSDVAGKGMPASLVMVMIRSVFIVTAEEGKFPREVVTTINNTISGDVAEDRYATFFYYTLDLKAKEITYTNAAHGPLLVYREATDTFEELDTEGMPLGIMGGTEYEEKKAPVDDGDLLVLYTDGVTEAMNKKRFQYGMDRLQEMIRTHKSRSMANLCEFIYADIIDFVDGADQHDDQTLFITKINLKKS